jgi:hypothetical protein
MFELKCKSPYYQEKDLYEEARHLLPHLLVKEGEDSPVYKERRRIEKKRSYDTKHTV